MVTSPNALASETVHQRLRKLPLPAWVKSATVERHDLPIERGPSAKSGRRGSAAIGARLPVYDSEFGPGCKARWINVGPEAWICQDELALGEEPPHHPEDRSQILAPSGLPYRYYFVGKEGSWAYASLEEADEGIPRRELEPGFGVAGMEEGVKGRDRYLRTTHNLWVPMRDLSGPAQPLRFQGEEVRGGRLDFGWVVVDKARTFSKADPRAARKERRERFERVAVLGEKKFRNEAYVRTAEDEWMRDRDLRRPTLAPPPEEALSKERWIDIELASQTLVVYEGKKPVFATLVSTGKGRQGSPQATPKGVHRVWVKLRSTDMSNLQDDEAARYYAIEAVPYVQFFSRGVGLHGIFWHRSLGHVKSQGCVNLAPLDAARLFELTSPRLPTGWHAVLPTEADKGTIVRVR